MIRRAAPAFALLMAAGLSLAACAAPAATPTAWQQTVQTLADQASAGDYASALASLDALEADVTARRDAGEITQTEADGILARIATVRADLTSVTPAPSPTPEQTDEPEQTSEPEEPGEPEQTTQPSESAEPEPSDTAAPTPDDTQEGEGNPGSNGNGDNGPGGGKDDKKPSEKPSSGPGKKDG